MLLKIVCLNFLLIASFSTRVHVQKDTATAQVLTTVEKPAEFRGGAEGWRKYLVQNLTYPEKAAKKKIEGCNLL